MTKQEAKRYVCRILAWTLRNDIDNGSAWMEQSEDTAKTPLSEVDRVRVRAAVEEMLRELDRRARRPDRAKTVAPLPRG